MGRLKETEETEFSFGHFELKRLEKHTHGDVQEGLGTGVCSYGRKSKLESTILQVIPTKKIKTQRGMRFLRKLWKKTRDGDQ